MASQVQYLDDLPPQSGSAASGVQYLNDIPMPIADPNTIIGMMTNKLTPGQPAPTMGQALSAGTVGVGQGLQNMLRPSAPTALPMGISALAPGIAQSMTRSAQQAVSPITDFNINKAVGLNQTPMQSQIESATAGTTPLALALLGGMKGNIATPDIQGVASRFGYSLKNAPFLGDFFSSLPKNATASDMSNAAANGGFKNIMDKIESAANTAYAPSTPHIFNPEGKVDLTGFTVNKTPTDMDLWNSVPKSMQTPGLLQGPYARQLLTARWMQDNPGKILSGEDLSNINPTVRKAVDNFMSTQNPTDLMNLKRMAGSNLAQLDPGIAQNGAAISAYKNLDSITGQIMENHLNQIDPTGTAANSVKLGNKIRSTMFHPVMNGSTLEKMSDLNPASATKEFPKGQPYYFNGATPDKVNSAVKNAQTKQEWALGPDHPITELNNIIQQKAQQENFTKNIKKYLVGGLIGGGAVPVAKSIVGNLINKN